MNKTTPLQSVKLIKPERPRVMRVLLIQGIQTDPNELIARQTLKPNLLRLEGYI